MTSPTIDIEALKAAAEKATPGEWTRKEPHRFSSERGVCLVETGALIAGFLSEANAAFIAAANPCAILSLIARTEAAEGEVERLKVEKDTAQSGVDAWKEVCEVLEAHLQDRVAMKDPANPEAYLRIVQSSIAGVRRSTEQICNARWADYRRHRELTERLEARNAELIAQCDRLVEEVQTTRELLGRAMEELRLIRAKDCGAVYDTLIRTDAHAKLMRVPSALSATTPEQSA